MSIGLSAWPFGKLEWSVDVDGGGIASLEPDDWFLACSWPSRESQIPKAEELHRAAVVLELAVSEVCAEEHLVNALKAAICCGLGRSDRSKDDCGFRPVLSEELCSAFDKAVSAAVSIRRCCPLRQSDALVRTPSGAVLCSQATFVQDSRVPLAGFLFAGEDVSIRRAALKNELSLGAACAHLIRLAGKSEFSNWVQVDEVTAVGRLLQQGPHQGLSAEQPASLANASSPCSASAKTPSTSRRTNASSQSSRSGDHHGWVTVTSTA